MNGNRELSEFLRASRARLAPEEIGLPVEVLRNTPAVRRVRGLRREEVALVAGVSVDYYTRLEQGRTRQVGRAVLNAIAEALKLNGVEREYFFGLVANQAEPLNTERPRPSNRIRPALQRVVDGSADSGAFVLGIGMRILSMNGLARELLFDVERAAARDRNLARWTFLDPAARTRYLDWEAVASDAAAILRRDAAAAPDDPDLIALIGELTIRSDDFRRMWAEHKVFACTFGTKRLFHPLTGEIRIDYEAFEVPDAPGQKLFIYTTQPGTRSHEAMQILASWATPAPSPNR